MNRDLSRLGKRRKEFGEAEGLQGPSERARASPIRQPREQGNDGAPLAAPKFDEGGTELGILGADGLQRCRA